MTLADYLRSRRETHEAFAARVGVHSVTVSKWATGAMRPSWPKLAAIAAATDGAVTAADFMPPPAQTEAA